MPNIPEKINVLSAVSASSHEDIWAVGYTRDYGNVDNTARTLAIHWDGREWKIVPTPNPYNGNNYLDGVITLGPNDAWAVGDTGTSANPGTLLFHWDGTSWAPGNLPALDPSGSSLYGLAALAPNDIWAVGVMGNQDFSRGLILHYDGSQWGIHKSFTEDRFPSIMYGVAARSANDVWAVGATGSDRGIRGLIAHWDGNTWTQLEDDAIGVNLSEAWDVAVAPGAPDVWVAGQYGQARNVAAVIHRGTGEWERDGEDLRVADRNFLRGIAATSNTDVWAVGFGQSNDVLRPLMMRTTNGTDWTAESGAQVDGAAALYDIAALPGGDLIAVGTANGAVLVEMYRDPCAPAPAPAATPTSEATQPPATTATPTPVPTFAATPIPGDTSRTFPETGKIVRGLFLDYWERNGGLAQQGYPISDMFTEISALNGKPYTVQYFERAVFEYHPENQAPFNVLLSQLGTFQYKKKYPSDAPGQTPNTSGESVLFAETGHRVGGKFLEYWQKNGGLAQQGLPISDEFTEKSDLNGQTYLVQYFERAVFELHPENQPPFDVLLSQLGTFQHEDKYGAR